MQLKLETSDRISSQLKTLGENLDLLKGPPQEIDCSNLGWAAPISLLPLAVKIYSEGWPVINPTGYLQTIGFPQGINDPHFLKKGKTYIPIVRFSPNASLIETLTTNFIDLVLQNIGFGKLIKNAFYYAVDEMVTNICEHSGSSFGWLLAQYYKTKEFLDVVILDQGLGIRGAYEKAFKKPLTDEQAIQSALQGVSIKDDWERGFGLRTTKDLVIQSEINGNFLIITGDKGFFAQKDKEVIFPLENWFWEGTIIIMRLKKVKNVIDLTRYVE